jgi:hypothetical protein
MAAFRIAKNPFMCAPRKRLASLLVTAACRNSRDYWHQPRIEHTNRTITMFCPSNDCINRDSCDRALCPSGELPHTAIAHRMPRPYQRREPADNRPSQQDIHHGHRKSVFAFSCVCNHCGHQIEHQRPQEHCTLDHLQHFDTPIRLLSYGFSLGRTYLFFMPIA